jgi:hypothetical protein
MQDISHEQIHFTGFRDKGPENHSLAVLRINYRGKGLDKFFVIIITISRKRTHREPPLQRKSISRASDGHLPWRLTFRSCAE